MAKPKFTLEDIEFAHDPERSVQFTPIKCGVYQVGLGTIPGEYIPEIDNHPHAELLNIMIKSKYIILFLHLDDENEFCYVSRTQDHYHYWGIPNVQPIQEELDKVIDLPKYNGFSGYIAPYNSDAKVICFESKQKLESIEEIKETQTTTTTTTITAILVPKPTFHTRCVIWGMGGHSTSLEEIGPDFVYYPLVAEFIKTGFAQMKIVNHNEVSETSLKMVYLFYLEPGQRQQIGPSTYGQRAKRFEKLIQKYIVNLKKHSVIVYASDRDIMPGKAVFEWSYKR